MRGTLSIADALFVGGLLLVGAGIGLALSACKPRTEADVSLEHTDRTATWHDEQRQVTCWIYQWDRGRSISCLPDQLINGGR